jgi:hypothetical protein
MWGYNMFIETLALFLPVLFFAVTAYVGHAAYILRKQRDKAWIVFLLVTILMAWLGLIMSELMLVG